MAEVSDVHFDGSKLDDSRAVFLDELTKRDIEGTIGVAAVALSELQYVTQVHRAAVAALDLAVSNRQEANWRAQMAMTRIRILLNNHIASEGLSDKEKISIYLGTLIRLGYTADEVKPVSEKLITNLDALESGKPCFIFEGVESGSTLIDVVNAQNVELVLYASDNNINTPGSFVANVNDGQNVIMIQSVRVQEVSQDYAVEYIQSAVDTNITPLDLDDILLYAKSRHSLDMAIKLADAFRDSDNKLPVQLQQHIDELCRIISHKMKEAIRSSDLDAICNPALAKLLSIDEFSMYIDDLIITLYKTHGLTRSLRAVSLLLLATGEVTKNSMDETMKDYETRVKEVFLAKIPRKIVSINPI